MIGDIDNTMMGPDTDNPCEDYVKWGTYMYNNDCPNDILTEYKKFKEWDKLCRQLKQHVSDSSGIYKKITKPKIDM